MQMKKTHLILDCNYLCHRAWFAMGKLQHGDIFTGVIFGFLKDLISLQDRFMPQTFVFCFDSNKSHRKADYPNYKSNREQLRSEEDQEMYKHFRKQLLDLRKEYLPKLGYTNIFSQTGYEADDCIGSICTQGEIRRDVCRIIISADHDLYQLLGRNCFIFHPASQSLITPQKFSRQWGISPSQWIDVKAIAGCRTDCIEGVKGVGEKTAAKFISGKLKPESKAFQAIVQGTKIWQRNKPLVKLPYPGTKTFEIDENNSVDASSWEELADYLGFKSLRGKSPKRKGFGIA